MGQFVNHDCLKVELVVGINLGRIGDVSKRIAGPEKENAQFTIGGRSIGVGLPHDFAGNHVVHEPALWRRGGYRRGGLRDRLAIERIGNNVNLNCRVVKQPSTQSAGRVFQCRPELHAADRIIESEPVAADIVELEGDGQHPSIFERLDPQTPTCTAAGTAICLTYSVTSEHDEPSGPC